MAISSLSDDSTVVTGQFGYSYTDPQGGGSATFGLGEPNETTLISPKWSDIFIARYNPDGTLAWAKKAGGEGSGWGMALTSLSDDSTVISGWFYITATFGEDELNEITLDSAGLHDIFIARYRPDGTIAWAKRAGGTDYEDAGGITALSDDTTVATGCIGKNSGFPAIFGEGEPNETILSGGGIFIARFEP